VAPDLVMRATAMLGQARNPLIMAGGVARGGGGWEARGIPGEKLGGKRGTDLKISGTFSNHQSLHVGPPALFFPPPHTRAIKRADVILSLDWLDLAGTLKSALGTFAADAQMIQVSLDHHLHNGWSMDYQGLPPVDLFIAADPDAVVAAMLDVLRPEAPSGI